MPSVRVQQVSFSFGVVPLFEDLTLQFPMGWAGVFGANGAGKSTLLSLLSGARRPERGAVVLEPDPAVVRCCAQRTEVLEDEVRAFASDPSGAKWRGRLGLASGPLERWSTLSPGERKRWQVGAALHANADVLLLDEPTNHLDVGACRLLLGALRRFRGVGVIVSHDRALLDALTTRTVRVRAGQADLLELPFTEADATWQRLDAQARDELLARRGELAKELRRLDEDRRRIASATEQRRAGTRMRDRHDSDARGMGHDVRAENAQRAHTRSARRTAQRATRVADELDTLTARFDDERTLFVRHERCPKPTVCAFEGPLTVGAWVLVEHLSVRLTRETRAVLRGPNGAGKSTLLRALVAHATIPAERVLDLPQELTREDTRRDLAVLDELAPSVRGRVLQVVDALGVDPDVLLATDDPSPGEARKLRLALGLMRDAWLLVLDEPTNHLDLPAIEKLERALLTWPGALVVVTHDERLASTLAGTAESWWLEAADGGARFRRG
jgi:ATPase subunit of ABC transporter with duplicated ATPase domains